MSVNRLFTKDNTTLLRQLKLGFKRIFQWNKYISKVTAQSKNSFLGYLLDRSSREGNGLLVSCFANSNNKTTHIGYSFHTVDIAIIV